MQELSLIGDPILNSLYQWIKCNKTTLQKCLYKSFKYPLTHLTGKNLKAIFIYNRIPLKKQEEELLEKYKQKIPVQDMDKYIKKRLISSKAMNSGRMPISIRETFTSRSKEEIRRPNARHIDANDMNTFLNKTNHQKRLRLKTDIDEYKNQKSLVNQHFSSKYKIIIQKQRSNLRVTNSLERLTDYIPKQKNTNDLIRISNDSKLKQSSLSPTRQEDIKGKGKQDSVKRGLMSNQQVRNYFYGNRKDDKDLMNKTHDTNIKKQNPEQDQIKQTKKNKLVEDKQIIVPRKEKTEQKDNHKDDILKYYRLGDKSEQIVAYLKEQCSILQTNRNALKPHHEGKWEKASKLCKGEICLNKRENGKDMFLANDVRQGELGNCYFLGSVAALAFKYPSLISKMFLLKENEMGLYIVKLFADGEWVNVSLDDEFPTKFEQFHFSQAYENRIWVPLLQKAWAKIHKSYSNIVSWPSSHALFGLTGAPVQYISNKTKNTKTKKQKNMIEQIINGLKKHCIMTCSGSQFLTTTSSQQVKQKYGIIANHCYSILNYIVIQGFSSRQILLNLRNPWGTLAWKGKWSFDCNNWNPSLRQQHKYLNDPKDGSFFISIPDFERFFDNVSICHVKQHYQHTSKKVTLQQQTPTYLNVQIFQAGEYFFSIHQSQHEIRTKKLEGKKCECSIVVMSNNDTLEYVGSKAQGESSEDINFPVKLVPGKYMIKLEIKAKKQECVFSSYGAFKVKITSQKVNRQYEDMFIQLMIKGFSQKIRGQIKYYSAIEIPEATREIKFSLQHGLGYIKITNPTKKSFTSKIELNESNGLQLLSQYDSSLQSEMLPKRINIFGFAVSPNGMSYSLSESSRQN